MGVEIQLVRVHEDGTCAKWRFEPEVLRLVLIIPAKAGNQRP